MKRMARFGTVTSLTVALGAMANLSREADMTTVTYFGPQPVFSHCLHRHVRVIHNGQRTFSEGEVFDNIQEQVLCLDCMETLTETEVRETWNARSTTPLRGIF